MYPTLTDSSLWRDGVIITEQQETAQSSKLPVFIKVGKELRDWGTVMLLLPGASSYGLSLHTVLRVDGPAASSCLPLPRSISHFLYSSLHPLWSFGTMLVEQNQCPMCLYSNNIVKRTWTIAKWTLSCALGFYLCCCLDLRCVLIWWTSWAPIQILSCIVLRGKGSTVAVFCLVLLPSLHGTGGRPLWATFTTGAGGPKPLFFLLPL